MTQLLLVDDHPMCADALERALKPLRPQAICHRALTLKAALLLLAQSTLYEVIFLDLKLPDSHGIDAIRTLLTAAPNSKVAVVSGYEDPRLMRDAYEAGAIGFLPKVLDLTALQHALAALLSGGFYFSADALAARPLGDGVADLTPRERQVLNELVSGQSTKLIARRLGLAPTTVDKHIDQIRAKVGVATRMQLVARIRELRAAAEFR